MKAYEKDQLINELTEALQQGAKELKACYKFIDKEKVSSAVLQKIETVLAKTHNVVSA